MESREEKWFTVSLVTKKDRYPFPDTAAGGTAAGSDPTSPFFSIRYNPETGKGSYKSGSTPWRRHEYDGTRETLRQIGLEVRFGGFGKAPPTVVGSPSKGQKSDYVGNRTPQNMDRPFLSSSERVGFGRSSSTQDFRPDSEAGTVHVYPLSSLGWSELRS